MSIALQLLVRKYGTWLEFQPPVHPWAVSLGTILEADSKIYHCLGRLEAS